MRKQLIGLIVMLLFLLGFNTCAYAVTINGDVYGSNLVWQIRTTQGLTFETSYSSKDQGLDWLCDQRFTNLRQSNQDTSSCDGTFNNTADLFTFTTYNIYPGYYNQISAWVTNSSTENQVMPGPVLNWMGNEQPINDYRIYLLLADGGIVPYSEPIPDNALVEFIWGNNTGTAMEPGDSLQEAFKFHIISPVDVPTPSISLTKEASVTEATVGTQITYSYTVTNTGDVTLTGVTLTDDKLGVIALSKTILAPGESASGILTYTVQESDLPDPLQNTATVTGYYNQTTVTAQDNASVILLVPDEELYGLTPGYWKNWRNHYTDEQFKALLVGTIAPDINTANAIFGKYSSRPGMELTILKAHLLATQLTLNLTKMPDLTNLDGAFLVESGLIEWEGMEITIAEAVQQALDIWTNPEIYTRSQILEAKNLLDYINNL